MSKGTNILFQRKAFIVGVLAFAALLGLREGTALAQNSVDMELKSGSGNSENTLVRAARGVWDWLTGPDDSLDPEWIYQPCFGFEIRMRAGNRQGGRGSPNPCPKHNRDSVNY